MEHPDPEAAQTAVLERSGSAERVLVPGAKSDAAASSVSAESLGTELTQRKFFGGRGRAATGLSRHEALLGQLQADSQRLLRRVSDSLQIFGIFFYFLCWILWFPCVLPTARCALCKCI